MVYGPQRRHAVASLATGIQTLSLVQHLLTPNILILAARLLAQVQIVGAAAVHPSRSLFSLFIMVTLLNMAAVLLHMLDFAGGMNGGKGMMLDFVGQVHQASSTRILLMDAGFYVLQMLSLVVSYVNHHAYSNPEDIKTASLPYDDLLLPDSPDPEAEEPEQDVESGLKRRRKPILGLDDEIWLDEPDNDGEADQELSDRKRLLSSTSSTPSGRHIREPPLVFSLSFPHLLALIFYLPSPPEPRPAFAGGTPLASPRPAPADTRNLPNVIAAQAILDDFHAGRLPVNGVPTTATTQQSSNPRSEDGHGDVDTDGTVQGTEGGDIEADGAVPATEDGSESPRRGRIPGDYWVESNRGRGNGG